MITQTNKFKLFNDPIYGFIAIPSALVFDLIEHPTFQRLRRISQLGLSSLVYAGANHTRFHHALGSMHLMQRAIHVLQSKGHAISGTEAEAVFVAILLHDIGDDLADDLLDRPDGGDPGTGSAGADADLDDAAAGGPAGRHLALALAQKSSNAQVTPYYVILYY